MTPRENWLRKYAVVAISLALAAVFIYAGADKIRNPSIEFADSVAAFAILPAAFIDLLALGLPPFEIACGVLILGPPTRRVAALALTLTTAMFFLALSSALLRGLTLDCGCFGIGAPSRPRMWMEAGLDLVLLGGALYVYLHSPRRSASPAQ